MKVAVIGAAGRMGRWFTRYFAEKKAETTVYDTDRNGVEKTAAAYGSNVALDLEGAVSDADLVVVSVPIALTADVVSAVLKATKRGGVVVEITSFKQDVFPRLQRDARLDVTLLSIHPMFGYGAERLSGHRIVVVPLRDEAREAAVVREFFPEADVISASVEEHDAAMAVVLSLAHFTSFVFAAALPDEKLDRVRRLAGTSFNVQLTLTEAILHDDPEFLTALQIDGQYALGLIGRLAREAEELREVIAKKDRVELASKIRALQTKMTHDPRFDQAYRKMYKIVDVLLGE